MQTSASDIQIFDIYAQGLGEHWPHPLRVLATKICMQKQREKVFCECDFFNVCVFAYVCMSVCLYLGGDQISSQGQEYLTVRILWGHCLFIQ